MLYLTSTYVCSSRIDCTYVQFWNVKMNFKLTDCNENHKCDCDGKLHDLYKCFTHICSCEICKGKKWITRVKYWIKIYKIIMGQKTSRHSMKANERRWFGRFFRLRKITWFGYVALVISFSGKIVIWGIANCIVHTP